MKMTKSQGRKRLMEMESKALRLYKNGYISLKDFEAILKMAKMRINQLK
tara:strand:+ start:146 stop:292 length:147 start_codon:yes stop_codon:yes gene_type:complete